VPEHAKQERDLAAVMYGVVCAVLQQLAKRQGPLACLRKIEFNRAPQVVVVKPVEELAHVRFDNTRHIRVDGRPIDELSPAELANLRLDRIGFVFQAYNLVPVLTARENVELIMELQGEGASARAAASAAVLSEVGLSDLADRRPAALSGGQQQRVAVARAIASRPAIVLADEPTANLDSHTAADLLRTMKSLNETRGIRFSSRRTIRW
jgi:predicted ABC-type transport system involved in lysophospholipase L1 biosynthesis ATPase subunit